MRSVVENMKPSIRSAYMKKKTIVVLSTVVVTIALGYLFFLSLLLGILVCTYISGKSVGERGKIRSIVIPLKRRRLHIHHWFCAVCLLIYSFTTGIYLLAPIITYGFLGGFVFQGIYSYSDWHRIVVSKHKATPTAVKKSKIIQIGQREFAVSDDNASYKERIV